MCVYVNSLPFPRAACADALGMEGYAVYMLTIGNSMVSQTEAWWSTFSIQAPGALQPT